MTDLETHPFLRKSDRAHVIAHRGFITEAAAEAGVFENTHAAFDAALTAGADILETDCRVTRDGEVVLFHDRTLERFNGETTEVSQLTHRELLHRLADHGLLLTISEALEAFPDARFNIDVKTVAAADEAGRSVARAGERVLLTSFNDATRLRSLRVAQQAGVGSPLPATSGGREVIGRVVKLMMWPWPIRNHRNTARAFEGIHALQVPERHGRVRVVTPRLIRAAHRHGVQVHVWTVNDPADMRRFIEMGVDGIVTDRTDLAIQVLRR